ncbi:Glucokinase [Desulfuromonas acetoxidans DSM 684]|uniref:Glucokinase n=2 Tax=Desulfuromonas acetoxidans TaxID=891 RepID=Q1JYC0_DESA6|nr:Glucokinase [Desulfuromonas acetoxidans DSM 684]
MSRRFVELLIGMTMILLAGDIGGTTSRFQWLDSETPESQSTLFYYPSKRFSSFTALLTTLLSDSGITQVDVACFGLPGPVQGCQVALTNLPWTIDACELQEQLPLKEISLVNDFQAAALGIDALREEKILCLHPGEFDPAGNRLVVGAGTGLGVAPVYQLEGHFYPQSSEGGHIAFAPVTDEQSRLMDWLHRERSHISYEDLLSGEGLGRLYRFHFQQRNNRQPTLFSAAMIHELAEQGDEVAIAALRMFVNIYGQFIGDVALIWPARAGIYIAGGIAGKIIRWMTPEDFTWYFLAKESMNRVVEKMPVYLVKDELLGLKGAMRSARRLAGLESEGEV